MLGILAALVGFVGGWNTYNVLLALFWRLNKRALLFKWREGVLTGLIFLAIGIAIAVSGGMASLSLLSLMVNLFAGCILIGAASHQLWLCWQATTSRKP